MYHIKSHNSEPYHQHTKTMLNAVLGASKMSQTSYSPSQVPPITYGYYVLFMLCTSSTLLPTVVLAIFHLTNIYTVKLQLFPPHFVSDSMSQSTTLIPILLMSPLRKRGDRLLLLPMLGIFSPFASSQMIPTTLSITQLLILLSLRMSRILILNSRNRMMTLANQ